MAWRGAWIYGNLRGKKKLSRLSTRATSTTEKARKAHASPLPVPHPKRALVDLGNVSKLQKIPNLGLVL